jgi:hypothetical protein
MDISFWSLGYFNGYFILIPGIFHCDFIWLPRILQWIFHSDPWDISMDISFWSLGYFIAIFILIPGIFQWIFHIDTWDISMDISFRSLGYFNGYFIPIPWIFHSYCQGCQGDGHMTNYQKWSKLKVVALSCSFLDLFELCSEVLLLWRYEVKHFPHHRLFSTFLCFSPWKQHQTI